MRRPLPLQGFFESESAAGACPSDIGIRRRRRRRGRRRRSKSNWIGNSRWMLSCRRREARSRAGSCFLGTVANETSNERRLHSSGTFARKTDDVLKCTSSSSSYCYGLDFNWAHKKCIKGGRGGERARGEGGREGSVRCQVRAKSGDIKGGELCITT